MPYLRVVYTKRAYPYDYVSADLLRSLIAQDEISHFFRPSEQRWVSTKFDPIRGSGGMYYGPERRRSGRKTEVSKHFGNREPQQWLKSLWSDIER